MKLIAAIAAAGLAAAPLAALANAPQPVKPVSASMYVGRWYEIARFANARQARCFGPSSDFYPKPDGRYSVIETCHRDTPTGPSHTTKASMGVTPGSANTRFKLSFLGGLVTQEYCVLDHSADDQSWALMSTPGGDHLWLLSRRPAITGSERSAADAAARALGFDTAKLISTQPPA